jgi:branched-chain amino acid transport system ATP-binding protein
VAAAGSSEGRSVSPLLELEGVTVRFGGLVALEGVDLTVNPGELISVIGPNGAGKSTLFNVISGVTAPTAGIVRIKGKRITRFRPDLIHTLGVGRTFQVARPIAALSVRENVLLGAGGRRVRRLSSALRSRRRDTELQERVDALIGLAGLEHVAAQSAETLSPGDLRRLEIARALADEPDLVLLDEPAAGIGADGLRPLAELIKAINQRGVAVLLVEHHVGMALALCHRAVVLESGKTLAEGDPDSVRSDERVIAAYLGTRKATKSPQPAKEPQP